MLQKNFVWGQFGVVGGVQKRVILLGFLVKTCCLQIGVLPTRKRVLNYHPHYIKTHPFNLHAFWWAGIGKLNLSTYHLWRQNTFFNTLQIILLFKIIGMKDLSNNQLFSKPCHFVCCFVKVPTYVSTSVM